ncbi:hypothetical protein C8R46DRAFT_1055489 [Mycena filopes]|nr:hypothetical protein C8R46DRAFT_1055489 [Mycena filopes]
MPSPAAKRQRTEDAPITRSELWHNDGSVVLQAESTQFRVHWSVLGRNSSFFRDMQSLPQPLDQPTVEGCPVVELPDNAIDVEFVLKALYTPSFLAQKTLPFAAIAAHVRIGKKYDFRELLDLAVARLTDDFPVTLQEFDALGPGQRRLTRVISYEGLSIDVVALARENNILSILPLAYYRILRAASSADDLFESRSRTDGTKASLESIDLRRCVSARERLTSAQLKPGYSRGWYWSFIPGIDCTGLQLCAEMGAKLRQVSIDSPAFKPFANVKLWEGFNEIYCNACSSDITEMNTAGRKRMWDELPGFFGLPAWGELKNEL